LSHRFVIACATFVLGCCFFSPRANAEEPEGITMFQFELRSLKKDAADQFQETFDRERWPTDQTAFIVCDMWDAHHCYNAVQRVGEMAGRMDQVLKTARNAGATIIHAPSSCVDHYQNHPARTNALKVKRAQTLPDQIGSWCYQIDAETAGLYPLDQTDGGEDDDPAQHQAWADALKAKGLNPRAPWKSQTELLTIDDRDFISDNGEEIWSILEERSIKHVVLLGVHVNMCVLGRPFGLRQLSKNGMQVVLMRDLTDSMYNPARWPYVDHFQGTHLIVRHIEKYVCPTITSDQILGDKPFRFQGDQPRRALIVIGESLYETERTLPEFAQDMLREQLGFETEVIIGKENTFANLAAGIAQADLLVLSLRRQALAAEDLQLIRDHIQAGKPVVAIRTASHAFDTQGKHPQGHAEWPEFDLEILGADYTGHFANDLLPQISITASAKENLILTDVEPFQSGGSLYQSKIVSEAVVPLLIGMIENQPAQPVAWTNEVSTEKGTARIFYTSLGHPADFQQLAFRKLLENGVRWSMQMQIGKRPDLEKK
jgi:type 1 glutamine amidotransferase